MATRGLLRAELVLAAWSASTPGTATGASESALATYPAGTIVWARSVGGLLGVTLPALREFVVRPYWQESSGLRKDYPEAFVQIVGGPDAHGRIAYVERRLAGRHFADALKVIGTDGIGDRLVTPLRSAAGARLGETLALAPRAGRAAFVSETRGAAITGRPYYLAEGALEVWDVDARRRLPLRLTALDAGLSWLPDSTTLAYVATVARAAIPAHLDPIEGHGVFARSSHVPGIHLLDTDSRRQTLIQLGTDPLVSSDGDSLLMVSLTGRLRRVTLRTGETTDVMLPDKRGRAVALLKGRYVLYRARPAEGEPIARSPYGSFRAGLEMISLKIRDIETGAFQTVVPIIDPRWSVSFGAAASAHTGGTQP
jgi:hypothetical protein